MGPLRVKERVGRLAYRLELSASWKIHDLVSIAHLEPAFTAKSDPYHRPRPDHPDAVISGPEPKWEIDRLLQKRRHRKGRDYATEYLVR